MAGIPVSVAAIASVAVLSTAGLAAAAPQQAPDPRLVVTDKAIAPSVPAEIIGANHRWPRDGLGMWDSEAGRPTPDIVKLSKRAGLGLVRYPGGTVANLFDWKRAIGPAEQRKCQVGGGFVGGAEPMDSRYGPDEHQQYVEAIGATTEIMANGATSSVRDLADFVEYMNAPVGSNPNGGVAWADRRAANGHPEPYRIHWWEIGNEPYLRNQRYWRSSDLDTAMRQYAFGGTQRQLGQRLGQRCDNRPSAGVSDGTANQSFTVHYPPVVPDSQTIRVGDETWHEVADLAEAGPTERAYTFDPKTGAVRFGDGTHGAIPPDDAVLVADYDSGPHPGFVDYYRAMKSVDPGISVCSSWEGASFIELMGAEHPYDCVGPHLYAHPLVNQPDAAIYDTMITLEKKVMGELTDMKRAIARNRPRNRPQLEVSEYGAISVRFSRPAPKGWPGSLGWSLYLADITAGLIEHGVRVGCVSNLNHERPTFGEVFGSTRAGLHYTARANVLQLYRQLVGTRPVATDLAGNPDATGDAGYRALRAVSSRGPDGVVRVMVINRDREVDVAGQIRVDGIAGPASVKISTLNGPDFTSYNGPDQPGVVSISTDRRAVPSTPFGHRFPAHSLTLLEVSPAAG